MSYNTSTDLWYQYFKCDEVSQAVILNAFYGGRALFATLGVFFNACIVYVTVKSKSLHGVCNIMIAMDSAFSLMLDVSFYHSFVLQFSGLRFVRYDQCFWFLLPFGVFGEMAQLTMVFTGIDRLLAVLFPFWYNKRSKKFHFLILGIMLALYSIYNIIIYYLDFNQSRDVMVACAPNEIGQTDFFGSIMHVMGLMLSGSLMIIYSALWFIVFQLRTTNINLNENNRKMIKSLIFIILLNMFGVFCRISVNLLFKLLSPNVFIKRGFSDVASLLVITVYSANAPVLYIISNEYRENFKSHFKWLLKVTRVGLNQVEILNTEAMNKPSTMPMVQIISIPNRRGSYVVSS